MSTIVKNIVFYSTTDKPLVETFQLLLTMQPLDPNRLFKDQFPVAWRVADFNANESQQVIVTYTAQLGVGVAQIDGDVIQTSSDIHIGLGQQAVYTTNGWKAPTPDPAPGVGPVHAINGVERLENISVGLYGDDDLYHPLLVEKNVTYKATMGGTFHPAIFVYGVNDVQENQLFTTEIENNLGSFNMANFGATTYFQVFNDPDTTELKILQTPSGPV